MQNNECRFDYDDQDGVALEIERISVEIASLKIRIKAAESEITLQMRSNPVYFTDGKKPAQNFIDSTFGFTGFNNELIPLRFQLAEKEAKHAYLVSKLFAMKTEIERWRTQSANDRKI